MTSTPPWNAAEVLSTSLAACSLAALSLVTGLARRAAPPMSASRVPRPAHDAPNQGAHATGRARPAVARRMLGQGELDSSVRSARAAAMASVTTTRHPDDRDGSDAVLARAGCMTALLHKSPIAPFCLYSLWVKSHNESDRDAIAKRPALHPTHSQGPLRASRAVASTHVGRKECLQCVTTV